MSLERLASITGTISFSHWKGYHQPLEGLASIPGSISFSHWND